MTEKKILIADDEKAIRKMLGKLLKNDGYELLFASDGQTAVDLARSNRIDLAILDLVMPRMGGIEALKEIKNIDQHTEAIMITGHSDIAALKKVFFDYGALDYLIKPFDMTEVKLTVQRALHNRAMALRKTSVEEELKNRILQLERDFKEKTFRLRESQIKYKNIVNNSTDAILVVQNGSVKFINQRGIDLSGFSLSEILEKPLMSLIHPEDHSKALGNNQLHINGKKASFDNRFRIIKKNGTSFWAENQTVATTWLDRPATLHFVRDISHQKKLEEMMIRSEKMNSLGKLSAGLAHEIRNPLAVISSCAQFCMENLDLNSQVFENFQVIHRNSQRADQLISQLLAFARPDTLQWKPVDINRVFEKMQQMAKLELNRKTHVRFLKRFEEGLPEIPGDEEKLGQVCLNLIQNAIQAVSDDGVIILETRRVSGDENAIEISVKDNGSGISPIHLTKIFDPFFTTKDTGTGLGLSICHSIVEQHQGAINAECKETEGTRVSVILPIQQKGKNLRLHNAG